MTAMRNVFILMAIAALTGCAGGPEPAAAPDDTSAVKGSCASLYGEMGRIRASGLITRLHKHSTEEKPSSEDLKTYERFLRLSDAYERRCR